MKKIAVLIGAIGLAITTALVAFALVGPPEVDKANATFKLGLRKPSVVQCPGEDAPDQYVTTAGVWKGGDTEVTPGTTDYSLSGNLTYAAKITVNTTTNRGVMTGVATLVYQPAAGGPVVKVYSGPLTLVLQQVDKPAGLTWVGRGLLNAPTFSKNTDGVYVKDGGMVLANVEVSFSGTSASSAFGSMNGQFGDSAGLPPEPVVPDYSVVWNGNTCA